MVSRNFVVTIVSLVFGFIELVLGLRILLKLFGASTNAEFVRWVYDTTEPLLEPFVGIFPSPSLSSSFVIEIPTLFALAVYVLIAYAIEQFVTVLGQAVVKKEKK